MAPTLTSEAPAETGIQTTIVLQPIVDLNTGRVAGYESLARFRDAQGRPLNTQDVFAKGISSDFELALITAALQKMPTLPGGTYLSVNASGYVFADPRLLSVIDSAVRLGIDPGRVVVELTESGPCGMNAAEYTRNALAERGVRVAIDDFGTGYSGVARVAALRPDIVKLDRSHVTGLGANSILGAMLGEVLRRSLRWATVVAEGVESASDVNGLRSIGVRYGQGYHLGMPAPMPVMQTPLMRGIEIAA